MLVLKPLRLPRGPFSAPLVSAHRGAATVAPENTLAAFELAFTLGADMVELDVHRLADGGLAVLHDVSIERTTGLPRLVQQLTQQELAGLDAGSWFDERFATEQIPAFGQVLGWARDRVYLNVDVRNYPFEPFYRAELMADVLIGALEHAGMIPQVVVQCLDHQLACELRKRNPNLVLGVTQHGRPVDPVSIARAAAAQVMGLDTAFLTPATVDGLHAAGIAVMASAELRLPGRREGYADIRQTLSRLLQFGVDIVVADDVEFAVSTVRDFRSVSQRA